MQARSTLARPARAFGFAGVAAGPTQISKILLFIFLVIFLVFLILAISAGQPVFYAALGRYSQTEGARTPRKRSPIQVRASLTLSLAARDESRR